MCTWNPRPSLPGCPEVTPGPNSPPMDHGGNNQRENRNRALINWRGEPEEWRLPRGSLQLPIWICREGWILPGEGRLRTQLSKKAGRFWLQQKQNFKGKRSSGSFKDPLQDQLTPANVDLSSHLMMATSELGAEPHLKNTFSSKKIGLGCWKGTSVLFSRTDHSPK